MNEEEARRWVDEAFTVPRETIALLQPDTSPWLDLGSGAGFPGLVIAALRPSWDVRLVESRKRRVEWLERVREALALPRCTVVGKRLEDVETVSTGVISARAFAPMVKLLDLSQRFSTDATVWLLPKGRSAAQELAEQPAGVQAMFHASRSAIAVNPQ